LSALKKLLIAVEHEQAFKAHALAAFYRVIESKELTKTRTLSKALGIKQAAAKALLTADINLDRREIIKATALAILYEADHGED
jgi:hypothetical protein